MNQDFRAFLQEFEDRFPKEVLTINEELSSTYEPSAIVMELDRQKRFPLVPFRVY